METSPLLPETAAQQSSRPPPGNRGVAQSSANAIGANFETFLQMLTVQMQNQDPLNPADPSDFATQLATFSTVEQQVQTNALLVEMATQMGALAVSQLSSWVGMDARAEVPVRFDGDPVTLFTRGNSQADRAELVVTDSNGTVVQRQEIETGRSEIEWSGITDSDEPLPADDYRITVEYFAEDDELLSSGPVQVRARIIEVRNELGTPILILDTGQEVDPAQIVGLLSPHREEA